MEADRVLPRTQIGEQIMSSLVRHLGGDESFVRIATRKEIDLHIRDAGFVGVLAPILIGILPNKIADLTRADFSVTAINRCSDTTLRRQPNTDIPSRCLT